MLLVFRQHRLASSATGGASVIPCPPLCQPAGRHCHARQPGHFLEIASLHPPLAALRLFPCTIEILSFQNFHKVLKTCSACRKVFFDTLSGPENSGPLSRSMAVGLLAVVFLVLLLVGLLLSVFLVALPVFLLHGTCLLSCPHGGTVCVQKIVLPPRGKLFTKKKKFLDFPVDRSEMVWYTIKAKQRRLIASASPPATAKRSTASAEYPKGWSVLLRGCREHSRFYFGLEVLRY